MRIANEDDEALYKTMLDDIIHIDDPSFYRSKITHFKEAIAARDLKERLHGLINNEGGIPDVVEPKPKKKVEEEVYTFKPFLYKDPYRNKIKSRFRT